MGALIAIVADAGSGNDRFNGGDEADTFFGGLGDDTLEPGAGFDSVDGQDGNDRLLVRDNTGDLARGGAGTDSAVADAADVLAEIESADVPPAADTKATALRVISKRINSKLRRGIYTARVRVECPAVETGGCKGTLSLLTAKSLRDPRRQGAVRTARLEALHAPPRPAPDAGDEAPAGHRQVRRPQAPPLAARAEHQPGRGGQRQDPLLEADRALVK